MTSNDIAKLSFKLLAVYFIVQLFYQTQDILWYLFYGDKMQEHMRTNYVVSISPSIGIFLSGIVLWFIAPGLANTIFKPKHDQEKEQVSLESFHAVAFSIAGLFLFVTSFREIVEYIVYQIQMASSTGKYPLASLIIVAILKIAFGLWLILGSKGVVNGIRLLRGAGVPKE
jgi:hypothetical protein